MCCFSTLLRAEDAGKAQTSFKQLEIFPFIILLVTPLWSLGAGWSSPGAASGVLNVVFVLLWLFFCSGSGGAVTGWQGDVGSDEHHSEQPQSWWLGLVIKIVHLNSPSFPADNSCISACLFIVNSHLLFYRLLKVMVNSDWKAQGYKKLFNEKSVERNWTCEKCREMPVCCIHLLMGITAVLSFVTLLCFGMCLPDLGIYNDLNPRFGQVCHTCSPMAWQAVQACLHSSWPLGAELGVHRHFAVLTPGFQAAWCSLSLHRTSTGSRAGLQLLLCSLVWWPGPAPTHLMWSR